MPRELKVSIGQYSDKGRKETNQDFHGAMMPGEPTLGLKGIAVAIADGISSSDVSRIASESAVKGFLTDYYCTPDSWSVKTSAQRVIAATNSWLHAQTRRGGAGYDQDKGYVCTLSVVILKSNTAHILHIGDARVYRVAGESLEQLTTDHRVVVSSQQTYLGRALGINAHVEIDYQAIAVEKGDVLVLATDGVYEHVGARFVVEAIAGHAGSLDAAAKAIVEQAYAEASPDNLTVQIVRIEELPDGEAAELLAQSTDLPLPPLLEPRMVFDGYRIVRSLHGNSRSHIYLASDTENDELVALKIPSIDQRDDPAYLKRFMMEEWVARRLDNAHVLKPRRETRKRNFLYVVTEYVDGQTLAQWMIDNPRPDIETVRRIVEQIATGLRAFHRKEMLHQDLRPQNIMIDKAGTVKIIDFGSTRVMGISEAAPAVGAGEILGTVQYTAPEYLVGEGGTPRSDIYSLGVITYQMIAGRLPYGARMAQARTRAQQRKIGYQSALDDSREIPDWIDGALRKAVHPDPLKRYGELSEYLYDLRHPNREFLDFNPAPLIRRDPLLFWKGLSVVLAAAVLVLLALQHGAGR
jgi:serine/threonine protein phosphatase PrpC/predicted Ser/Thr protein kinase